MIRNAVKAVGLISVVLSLGILSSPSAFADGSSNATSSLAPTTVTDTPDGCTGVLVADAPLVNSGTTYGEISLYYDSCDRDVKAIATSNNALTLGEEMEACLHVSTEPSGTDETCNYLFNSGSSVTTGWYSDAGIETQGYGWLLITASGPAATGTTSYY